MSRENVEVARQAIDAINRGDSEALAAISHPEMEFHSALATIEGGVYSGPQAWRTYLDDMSGAWADWRIDAPRLIEAPEDRVVLIYRLVGTGRASGAPVEQPIGAVADFRDGKLWRVQGYFDPADALEAVGLRE